MQSNTRQAWLIPTVVIVTLATLVFGFYQNSGDRLGGTISIPKILWLNFALITFFVIPGFLAGENRAFRFVWWSFLIRAAVEGYLLTQTSSWRCWMGIAHGLFTLTGFLLLYPRKDPFFSGILGATLVVECSMASLFSKVARPEEGVFFASDGPQFAVINTYTMLVIAIAYPTLIAALITYRKGALHESTPAI